MRPTHHGAHGAPYLGLIALPEFKPDEFKHNLAESIVGTQMGGSRQGTPLSITTAVTTAFAGTNQVYSSLDGTGTAATFYSPYDVTTDGTNLYVADAGNHKIRKIVISTGVVTTLAGSGSIGAVDATGTAASFNHPGYITTDGSNLYVTDSGNYKIRKVVISTGVVTTLAGSGSIGAVDAIGTAASFYTPAGITTDGVNLFVADMGANTIRKIVISTGAVTTLAGNLYFGSTDATGTAASFNTPIGITTDGVNLFVSDTYNNKIRKIVIATAVVTTLAGSGSAGNVDGTGVAAYFSTPYGFTTDGSNLYVVDSTNNKIRKIVIGTGVVTSLTAVANGSYGITTDGKSLFVADIIGSEILKIQ